MAKELERVVNDYANDMDMEFTNEIIKTTKELGDFEMNKTTLMNIGEWALDGKSNEEIRKHLDLTPKQWTLLCNICPTLLYVMKSSRALADVMITGSLVQTAIGGKTIRKQVAKNVKEYNEDGIICGEHLETIWLEEELPPNPILLKFLAEHKLSEKFGDKKVDNTSHFKGIIDNLSPEERAILEAQAGEILNVKN